jgi:hypothetical protein
LAQALAPLIFGELAALVAGIAASNVHQAPVGTKNLPPVSPAEASGLEAAFLILLVALFAGGVAMLKARHTYARDVATAGASEQGTGDYPARRPRGDTQIMPADDSRTSRSRRARPEEGRRNRKRWD